ncbi:hypothetical protein GCM10009840_28220 [Pseudolysinimonas kribbensis]|uniref:Uncharacterized protein n=1 Tax=Pseudolysinimonas kribbensis TaxID=433641 RepID=A0ABQ6K6S6_9MICO|nr:hypothetical protein GCM10025881_31810 [Pseudolysinimonas kribbensis]
MKLTTQPVSQVGAAVADIAGISVAAAAANPTIVSRAVFRTGLLQERTRGIRTLSVVATAPAMPRLATRVPGDLQGGIS